MFPCASIREHLVCAMYLKTGKRKRKSRCERRNEKKGAEKNGGARRVKSSSDAADPRARACLALAIAAHIKDEEKKVSFVEAAIDAHLEDGLVVLVRREQAQDEWRGTASEDGTPRPVGLWLRLGRRLPQRRLLVERGRLRLVGVVKSLGRCGEACDRTGDRTRRNGVGCAKG